MFVKKNRKNRTWFVGHRNPNLAEVFYSVPFKKSKRPSKLTIRISGNRVDLNGRQIQILFKVLKKGKEAKNWYGNNKSK